MTLTPAALPIAAGAGALGVLSPCVWPLVPVVMASAAASGRAGPVYLTAGLSLAFALAGTLLSFLLVSTGLDPELFRFVSGTLLLVVAAVLLDERLGQWVNLRLSLLTGRFQLGGKNPRTAAGQFGIGLLLGLVWLPCVGPTLGAAIALAATGQQLGMAFLIMAAYGLGTGTVLLAAGLLSHRALVQLRPRVLAGATGAKKLLGWTLTLLGTLVLTGMDKRLEAVAVGLLPDWMFLL